MPVDDPRPSQRADSRVTQNDDTKSIQGKQTRGDCESDLDEEFHLQHPETIGKYRVRRLLGKGAMGAVYLAYDPIIEREVAIKVLHPRLNRNPNALQRFLGEARAAGRLNHPNAIAIYEVADDEGVYFIVMELAVGGSVRELLQSHATPPFHEACRITVEAARGLEAAHRLGLIHRDIKPENLMLSAGGAVKLVDFGLARLVNRSTELALTQTGQLLGTPLYMSPEQIRGGKLDARTDIYSLGVTFFQLLTGVTPFMGDSVAQLVYAHLEADRPDPARLRSDLPSLCSTIVAKAMSIQPEDRYASVTEMIQDIELLGSAPSAAVVWGESATNTKVSTGLIPRILVVEPSKLAAQVVHKLFRGAGCQQVKCLELAGEVIGHVAELSPDVVVVARQLPDLSGESLYDQIGPALNSPDPVWVLLSSDSPLDVMAQSKIEGTAIFARKQRPGELVRAIHCCTDYAFPVLPVSHTRDAPIRVAVVSENGSVRQDLLGWMADWGIDPWVVKWTELADHEDLADRVPELHSAELVLCVSEGAITRNDVIDRWRGPLAQVASDRSTLAVLDETSTGLRLRGIRRQAFVAACEKPFDRTRLARLLRFN